MVERASPSDIGTAKIAPSSAVVAGEYGTWQLIYTVGARGIQPGGRIDVETDTDTDWGHPQIHDPQADEYVTVEVPDGADVITQIVSNRKQRFILAKRGLTEGETITVTYGDQRGGSRGSRAQTFLEPRHYWHVRVDVQGNGRWELLPDSPEVAIVGGTAAHMYVQATSNVTVNEEFRALLRVEDECGNPTTRYKGTVHFSADGVSIPRDSVTFEEGVIGVVAIDGCKASESGTHRIRAHDEDHALYADSNPIEVHDAPLNYRLCWGDLHGGQVADAGKIEDFFRYARDIAGIDFVGYQRNDHAMSPADYRVQQRLERDFYLPGSFVPMPGYEWSAETDRGGHHNVFFRRFDQPARRNSHRGLDDTSEVHLDLPHITDVYDAFRGTDTMITPHVGGEHSDLTHHDPLLEPALEVTSDHGSFHWFLEQALENGYRMGFLGGSDSHNGRPGNDRPGFQLRRYAKSGLTGLYTNELSIAGVIEAVRARRCYATTGARMLATVTADGHFMGSEYQTSTHPTVHASIEGTSALEEVTLFRGLEQLHRHSFVSERRAHSLRISWEGAGRESSYSGLIWDGTLIVTGGALTAVRTVRFDSPRSHVSSSGNGDLTWHSWTCGYRSGIVIDLDGDAQVDLSVVTTSLTRSPFGGRGQFDEHISYAPRDQVRLTVRPSDLFEHPQQIKLGELDRKITVELEPRSHTSHASFEFTDENPVPGVNAYWIRALQMDGEMLWTSPIFVDYTPDSSLL